MPVRSLLSEFCPQLPAMGVTGWFRRKYVAPGAGVEGEGEKHGRSG